MAEELFSLELNLARLAAFHLALSVAFVAARTLLWAEMMTLKSLLGFDHDTLKPTDNAGRNKLGDQKPRSPEAAGARGSPSA